jgi:hypothetical protein
VWAVRPWVPRVQGCITVRAKRVGERVDGVLSALANFGLPWPDRGSDPSRLSALSLRMGH